MGYHEISSFKNFGILKTAEPRISETGNLVRMFLELDISVQSDNLELEIATIQDENGVKKYKNFEIEKNMKDPTQIIYFSLPLNMLNNILGASLRLKNSISTLTEGYLFDNQTKLEDHEVLLKADFFKKNEL